MGKLNFTWRIWALIILLVLSLLSVFGFPPSFLEKGVLITSVEQNSTAFQEGLRQDQVIIGIDNKEINNLNDFSNILKGKFNSNESVKTIITTKDSEYILFSNKPPALTVIDIPKSNLRTGLDLSGGARALIKAEEKFLTKEELDDLVDITSNRLNEFGISDINVKSVSDLSGENFMLIEIAGATPNDLETIISQQGKFEAKIGNETVFIGGERDIASVGRGARDAFIEACQPSSGAWFCNFRFTIFLSEDAAKRHADVTAKLDVNNSAAGNPSHTGRGGYLSKPLDLYLDDKLVNSLLISESLKGRVETQIVISGSGTGTTEDEAYDATSEEMNRLQTVLITGSLPFKLEIVKLDTISPTLGNDFIKSIFFAGAAALFAVTIIIFLRYKGVKSSLALLLTSVSEIIIILGIASLIEWNLDLPSIAGILATIGTGIDDLIIVIDESRSGTFLSLKQRLKRAFSIILGAYFTSVVALLPLLWAGAGLLKGFAITTLIGISAGVLITRPAFADMIKRIEE
ncbi:MAG: hypothetical protein ACE5ES_02040 [Candidatus Nanoarchaeia archaeon]